MSIEDDDNIPKVNFNFTEINNSFKLINSNILTLQKSICKSMASALSKSIQPIDTVEIYKSKIYKSMVTELQKAIQQYIPKIKLPESLIKTSKYLTMIKLLEDTGWPFYLYVNSDDYKNFEKIVAQSDLEIKKAMVEKVIYFRCNNNFISSVLEEWNENIIINEERKKLLSEAIICYRQELYAACVALLSCQLDGIITDLYNYAKKEGFIFDEDFFCKMYKSLHPTDNAPNKKIASKMNKGVEKYKLISLCSSVDEFGLVWSIIMNYLIKVIYTSDDSFNASVQPCRNKICHGIQTNYNTKEHALKSILVIDLIMSFSNYFIE